MNTETRTFSIFIHCDNAAFDGAALGPELARILASLVDDLRDDGELAGSYFAHLNDANGNRCGTAELVRS
jgi:hypothetical protein